MEDSKSINLAGVRYSFPRDHVTAFHERAGSFYVRLAPPGESFELVLSDKSYRENDLGEDVPTIAHVNDVPGGALDVIDTPTAKVVCRRDNLNFNCGLRVTDAEQLWSVLFNRDRVGDAAEIRAKAQTIISNYRSQ